MKIIVKSGMLRRTRTQSFLRWIRYLFFTMGILSLSYVGFALLDARLYQAYQTWRFVKALRGLRPSIDRSEHVQSPPLSPALMGSNRARAESPGMAGHGSFALGRIEIRTIALEAMIMEGTDYRTLRRAVGHVPGTPLPGEQGNVVITGHRDTFFRALRNIHKDDEITLTTLSGSYRYRVESIKVVKPQDTEVLDASSGGVLTLVTCYPFYFVGAAPKRFIVRALKISDSKDLLAQTRQENK